MTDVTPAITGGCLCGALRYEATTAPDFSGYCLCVDCRRASGSGFIPFMGFAAAALTVTGAAHAFHSPCLRGTAVRNFCPTCGALVFGGELGVDDSHTIYAGTLDDPAHFRPRAAIFVRDKPDWVLLPPGLRLFEAMP
ncbi:GFA family protein [Sphingomonas nostoxanthinifaciens]|uniref:GFA family protein n=1 Tax=Sphingomonas nostoxanthinifaciens TaxID=2872652 RepID=UPI001CC1E439|nr:GFA family protein [Sphingomonas nostoxanthinifaciens]UAK26047.1 GFA family protein [Sphingomonas nostoxanthinifaciens]